jgi:hypothetical protein
MDFSTEYKKYLYSNLVSKSKYFDYSNWIDYTVGITLFFKNSCNGVVINKIDVKSFHYLDNLVYNNEYLKSTTVHKFNDNHFIVILDECLYNDLSSNIIEIFCKILNNREVSNFILDDFGENKKYIFELFNRLSFENTHSFIKKFEYFTNNI